jgi:hypothetical protein
MTTIAKPTPPLLLAMPKGFEALNVGQTKGKSLLDINGGPLETVEIGRRRLIIFDSMVRYVAELRAAPRQDARRNGAALDAAARRSRAALLEDEPSRQPSPQLRPPRRRHRPGAAT